MKLQILQESLAKAVSLASRFASSKSQLPILGNILLTTKKTKVVVASTNLEISVSVSVGAKIDEEGEISVSSRILNDLVSNLPKQTIAVESEKEELKVIVSGLSSKVMGMTALDFPKVPSLINKQSALTLPKKELTEAINQVAFAVSADETRPVLTGVLIVIDKGEMSLVATDGFRLSQKILKVPSEEKANLILPRLILSELSKDVSGEAEIFFSYSDKDKQAIFGAGDVVLSSRVLEGDYPDYQKIIPKSASVVVRTDKEEFARAVKLASVFARESANVVKIKIFKEFIRVFADGVAGKQEAKVDAKVDAVKEDFEAGLEIAFNYRFLEDFLHSVKGEEVILEFSGPSSAGVFKDSLDSSYLHLIMPVKLQS